jgi:hypothetical protein
MTEMPKPQTLPGDGITAPLCVLPGMTQAGSLPVFGHQLLAAAADARAVLLQAGEHHLITFAHDGAAKTRNVAGAGIMFVGGLRRCGGGNKKQRH